MGSFWLICTKGVFYWIITYISIYFKFFYFKNKSLLINFLFPIKILVYIDPFLKNGIVYNHLYLYNAYKIFYYQNLYILYINFISMNLHNIFFFKNGSKHELKKYKNLLFKKIRENHYTDFKNISCLVKLSMLFFIN
jgi:hypothetical protein